MSKVRSFLQRKLQGYLRRAPASGEGSAMAGHESPVEALLKLGYVFNEILLQVTLSTYRHGYDYMVVKNNLNVSEGELRKHVDGVAGSEPFQFRISEQEQECQLNYENIGAVVTEYVYQLLESQEHMSRLPVPENSSPDTGTFIFASPEHASRDTLLLLLHGSGVVRAGQWARSLIINENLDKGTQIPYIRKAVSKDYGVLVLNTNDNHRGENQIPKSGSPHEHAQYVWDTYVAKAKATSVLIAAHSYGGLVTMDLAQKNKKDFKNRVKAIALTDSVHGYSCKNVPSYVLQIARNWVSSEQPLDAPERGRDQDVEAVSAGHPKHEMTSYSCMDSVFKFFEEKLSKD